MGNPEEYFLVMVSFEPNRKGTLHAKLARKRH
jgi:hypothetical protein